MHSVQCLFACVTICYWAQVTWCLRSYITVSPSCNKQSTAIIVESFRKYNKCIGGGAKYKAWKSVMVIAEQ